MAKGPDERQDAMRLIGDALFALRTRGAVSGDDLKALLASWRVLAPLAHPGAGDDTLDTATLGRLAAWAPVVLGARRLTVRRGFFRAPPVARAGASEGVVELDGVSPADALLLALTLSLESAKRAHGLSASPDALRAAFSSPEAARATIDALRAGGDARSLSLAHDEQTAEAVVRAVGDRPVTVLCGAGARAAHDLLSPFPRRLGARAALLGRGKAAPSDNDVYRGVELIHLEEPQSIAERLSVEEADGLVVCGRAVVVLMDRVAESSVDRRVREAHAALKKARAAIVLVDDADALTEALSGIGPQVVTTALVGMASAACTPALSVDGMSGTVVSLDNVLAPRGSREALISLPSLGLRDAQPDAPTDNRDTRPVDDQTWPCVQAVLQASARTDGPLSGDAQLAVRALGSADGSAVHAATIEIILQVAEIARTAQIGPSGRKPRR